MFTKRHYIKIAGLLNAVKHHETRHDLANGFINMLSSDNKLFDKERFLQAVHKGHNFTAPKVNKEGQVEHALNKILSGEMAIGEGIEELVIGKNFIGVVKNNIPLL
jgi:hypothetical protein